MKKIIFSYIVINLTIALILILILLTVTKPKKYPEFYVPDVKIEVLESFDFIYSDIDYPYDYLSLTGKLILDSVSGSCIQEKSIKTEYRECSDGYCEHSYKRWTNYITKIMINVPSNVMIME